MDNIGWELGSKARKTRLGAARIFTHEGRCRGVNGYVANVRFWPDYVRLAPESGRK